MKKSLLDIQQEIRELEGKVKDISASIAGIYEEIDSLRNDETDTINYEMIRLMSQHLSFGPHPLKDLNDAYICRIYLKALLSLVQADYGSEYTINRLIFIQWLLSQTGLDNGLEVLLKDSLKISPDSFGELAENIPEFYRSQLVMDALITANICGQANNDVLVYIANMCSIFGMDKEQLRILSIMAGGVLKQDLDNLKKSDLSPVSGQIKAFKHYFKDILYAQRKIVVKAPDKRYPNFIWQVKQKQKVKKGDVIAKYVTSWNILSEIKAPCAGTLFQFRNNCINYGVIAHEADNKDSIKNWVLQRR